jgi:hypothetical protein
VKEAVKRFFATFFNDQNKCLLSATTTTTTTATAANDVILSMFYCTFRE